MQASQDSIFGSQSLVTKNSLQDFLSLLECNETALLDDDDDHLNVNVREAEQAVKDIKQEIQAECGQLSSFELTSALIMPHNDLSMLTPAMRKLPTIQLNQPAISNNDSILNNNGQPNCQLPSLQSFTGDFNFSIGFAPSPKETRSTEWSWSAVVRKLFVKLDTLCPLHITLDNHVPKDMLNNLYIKIVAVYKRPEVMHVPIEKCPNHRSLAESTPNFPPDLVDRFILCQEYKSEVDKNSVVYDSDPDSKLPSIIVPYRCPDAGCKFSVLFLKFMCFSSCPGSLNRRPVEVVVTLESHPIDRPPKIIGRQTFEVKVCACPNRDRMADEAMHEKRLAIVNPAVDARHTRNIDGHMRGEVGAQNELKRGTRQPACREEVQCQTVKRKVTKTIEAETEVHYAKRLRADDVEDTTRYNFEVYGRQNFELLKRVLTALDNMNRTLGSRADHYLKQADCSATNNNSNNSQTSEYDPNKFRRNSSIFAIIRDHHSYAMPPPSSQPHSLPDSSQTLRDSEIMLTPPLNSSQLVASVPNHGERCLALTLADGNHAYNSLEKVLNRLGLARHSTAFKEAGFIDVKDLLHVSARHLQMIGLKELECRQFFTGLWQQVGGGNEACVSSSQSQQQGSCSPEVFPLTSQETLPASQMEASGSGVTRRDERSAYQVLKFSMKQSISVPSLFNFEQQNSLLE